MLVPSHKCSNLVSSDNTLGQLGTDFWGTLSEVKKHPHLFAFEGGSNLETERQPLLGGRVVVGHLHFEGGARVAEVLGDKGSALLADQEGGRVPVKGVNTMLERTGVEITYVLQPTLSGQIERSATLRPLTSCTFRRSSSTPCLTMLLPSLGAMEHVPKLCQVDST